MEISIMAHFAELDLNNNVIRVLSVRNEDITDENGNEQEALGIAWLQNLFEGTWVKTSYNTIANTHLEGKTPFRKNYAAIGMQYDKNRDAFIHTKPPDDPNNPNRYVLNEDKCIWIDTLVKDITMKVTRI
jgi:hypothetical protein